MTKRNPKPLRVVETSVLSVVVGGDDSRNIEFEMIKNEVQKLSSMQEATTNTMHELAASAIRNISP